VRPTAAIAIALALGCGDNLAAPVDLPDTPIDDTPVFVNTWGELGNGPGQFFEPSSVELDSRGVVIVAGHEDRVQRFTGDGVLIGIFGVSGSGDGQFNHPHGLAVDRARGDLIYVGDQENDRLQVFDRDGEFVRQWGDDKFAHIHDVGIDRASGELFIGDLDLHTLRKFSPTGEVLGEYGGPGDGPGRFNGVWGVSTDASGNVYVADTYNRRIQVLDSGGRFVDDWPGYGGVPWRKPTGVFVDDADVVYVTDSLAQIIALFDTSGALLDLWDLAEIVGYRTEPEDIVIDAAGEHIYIAEVFRHSVLHLRLP
jgi:DNA-binding beta-propeller fold protein YncE